MATTKKAYDPKKLGESIGINFKKYALAEFKKGMKVEREHADITKGNPTKTAKIVWAHLKESPGYYKRLKEIESKFKKKKKS